MRNYFSIGKNFLGVWCVWVKQGRTGMQHLVKRCNNKAEAEAELSRLRKASK